MAERTKPAETFPQISYKYFAEQIDERSGIPVGLVPLEPVFTKGLVKFVNVNKWHDVGVGVFASTKHIANKIPLERKEMIDLVTSDVQEFPEFMAGEYEELAHRFKSGSFICAGAFESVKQVKDCDLITMINMIHLVEDNKMEELVRATHESLADDGSVLVSTTFIKEWAASEKSEEFQTKLTGRVSRMALRKKLISTEALRSGALENEAANYYISLFERNGFEVTFPQNSKFHEMPCTVESYDRIGHDPDWLARSLKGVDMNTAQQLTHEAVDSLVRNPDYDLEWWTPLPRNTLVFIARKISEDPTIEIDDRFLKKDDTVLASV